MAKVHVLHSTKDKALWEAARYQLAHWLQLSDTMGWFATSSLDPRIADRTVDQDCNNLNVERSFTDLAHSYQTKKEVVDYL